MSTQPYVEYGAFSNGPGPFVCNGAELSVFFLEANHDKLVALLDKVFATSTAGATRYYPLGKHVMLTFGSMKVSSQTSPFDQMGYVDELHAALWIMAAAVDQHGEELVAQHLALFIPVIFIGNPLSLVGGREVIGYNKVWGWITLPDDTALDTFNVDGFGGNFATTTCAERFTCLTLQRQDGEPLRTRALNGIEEALQLAHQLLFPGHDAGSSEEFLVPGLTLLKSLFHDLHTQQMTQVFLRQFRSPIDGKLASQQQVVETDTQMHDVHVELIDHRYDVRVQSRDSHPFGKELGLVDQEVAFAMRVKMSFVQGNGRVLWDSTKPR